MKGRAILGLAASLLVSILCLLAAGCNRGGGVEDGALSLRPGDSLQEAIDRAESGSTVRLAAGTWNENVVISKSLTLKGAGRRETRISGVESGYPVIRVMMDDSANAPEVVLEALQVADAQGSTCAELRMYESRLRGYRGSAVEVCPYGILVEGAARVSLSDCLVSDNRSGVAGIGTATIDIRDCEIRGNDWEGIYVSAMAVVAVNESTVSGNGAAGVGVANEASAAITECVIESNTGDGVGVADLGRVIIRDCIIAGNGWSGVKLVDAAVVTLAANRIVSNKGYGIAPLSDPCYPDEQMYFGEVFGEDNWIPGSEESDGNQGGAICPEYPGGPWPEGFLADTRPES